jgi:hypothetical protein
MSSASSAQITTTERLYGHLEEAFARTAAADTEAIIRRAAGIGERGMIA